MRKSAIIFLSTIISVILSGCENKRDDNGDLGGMWQMTCWIDENGNQIYPTSNSRIYYKVRKNLFMLQRIPEGINDYHQAYFKKTSDSIFLYHIWHYPDDTIANTKEILQYGFPENGRLHIIKLSSDKMILNSGDSIKLTFRKY